MPSESEASASAIAITLPDGKVRQFPGPVTGGEIAAAIGPGLAKAAVAIKLDGVAKDLTTRVTRDAKIAIVTRDNPEALEILRHDAAHVMAEAIPASITISRGRRRSRPRTSCASKSACIRSSIATRR